MVAGRTAMKTLLIADDESIVREPIAVSLRALGYHVQAAPSISQARACMEKSPPQLVLVASRLLGGSGDLVSWMRGDARFLKTPVLILTDRPDVSTLSAPVGSGPTEHVLRATFSLADLFERIQRHVGAPSKDKSRSTRFLRGKQDNPSPVVPVPSRGARDTARQGRTRAFGTQKIKRMSQDECVAVLRRFSARAFSPVVAEVIRITSSPDAQRDDLVKTLLKDPALTSRVLQASNSAAIGRRSAASIEEAVTVLGFAQVRKFAASMGVFSGFGRDIIGEFDPIRLWQHSLAVGSLMEHLAMHTAEHANYMIGLCHDLGSLSIWNALGPYLAASEVMAKREGCAIEQTDARVMGTTRTELACIALDTLGLPSSTVATIKEFLRDHGVTSPKPLVRRLHAADAFAHALLFCWSRESPLVLLNDMDPNDALAASGIDWSGVTEEVNSSFQQLASTVPGLPPAPPPLFSRRPCRVLYTCRDKLAGDPIRIAIASLATLISGRITARSARASPPHALIASLSSRDSVWNEKMIGMVESRPPDYPVLVLNGGVEQFPHRAGAAVVPARPMLWQVDDFIGRARAS